MCALPICPTSDPGPVLPVVSWSVAQDARYQARGHLHEVVRVIALVRTHPHVPVRRHGQVMAAVVLHVVAVGQVMARDVFAARPAAVLAGILAPLALGLAPILPSSEERREGEECGGPFRSRWCLDHPKKKTLSKK